MGYYLSKETIKEIRARYLKGQSQKTISKIVGCSESTVRKYVVDLKPQMNKEKKEFEYCRKYACRYLRRLSYGFDELVCHYCLDTGEKRPYPDAKKCPGFYDIPIPRRSGSAKLAGKSCRMCNWSMPDGEDYRCINSYSHFGGDLVDGNFCCNKFESAMTEEER